MMSKTLNARAVETNHGEMTDRFIGMSGAEVFHLLMQEHGVDTIFGYPGGNILPILDAIHESPHFKFVLPRHEQGAGHMAEGYARSTGKVGVVLVTSGPGATNTVTPLQDALMDGTPMIVFSGQASTGVIGTDAFQEADMTGITRPCTKWNTLVKDPHDLPRVINQAFYIATTGRPGPVLVDIPKDVSFAKLTKPVHVDPYIPGYNIKELGTSDEIGRVAEMINGAKKPLFYIGQGVIQSNAVDALRKCAEQANIPVTTTIHGLGGFDAQSDLAVDMLGMHGAAYANWAVRDADVLIAVGARFDDRVTGDIPQFAPAAREAEAEGRGGIIHFDIAPDNINKTVQVTLGVEGDAKKNLEALLPMLEDNDRSAWLAEIKEWKKAYPYSYDKDEREFHMKPQEVIEELYKQTEGEAIVVTGVGQHQMWAAQFYKFRYPRTMVTSGGLGTMGFGVPASVGAAVGEEIEAKREGRKPRHVVNIDGDGSFSMTAMEMTTAAQFNIKAKSIILNNDFQGMVKQWQDLFFDRRYSHTEMQNPDFVKLADAMNCKGFRVTKSADLPKVMKEFLDYDGPAVLEALIEKDEHVYPMMPPGKGADGMVLGPASDSEFDASNAPG